MLTKIQNIIKSAYLSLSNSDTSYYPTAQASYKGKSANFVRLSPYGLDSNPPSGSFVLLFSSYGQESNKFGISSDMARRQSSLNEGEVALYNTKTGSSVLLKSNGEIEISGSSVTINGIEWGTHVHPDPDGGKTGPPENPV